MQTANYEFKTTTHEEYELNITLPVQEGIIKTLMKTAIKATVKKIGLSPSPEQITENMNNYQLNPFYYKLIKTTINPITNEIYKEINKDGIKIIREDVTKVIYIQDQNKKFTTQITIKGFYLKNPSSPPKQ
jgi:hypothetical protein